MCTEDVSTKQTIQKEAFKIMPFKRKPGHFLSAFFQSLQFSLMEYSTRTNSFFLIAKPIFARSASQTDSLYKDLRKYASVYRVSICVHFFEDLKLYNLITITIKH